MDKQRNKPKDPAVFCAVSVACFLWVGSTAWSQTGNVYPGAWNVEVLAQIGGGVPRAVCAQGNYAYFCDVWNLVIFDLSDPSSPDPVGRRLLAGTGLDVVVSGRFAYVLCTRELEWPYPTHTALQIIDVTAPTSPRLHGSYNLSGSAGHYQMMKGSLDVAEGFAYCLLPDQLEILDVSDPASPTLQSVFGGLTSANHVEVVGDLAYLATRTGLEILDVSDPASPVLHGLYNLPAGAAGLDIVGDLAYVTDYVGLGIYDVSDATSPTFRGAIETPQRALKVHVVGERAYVAAYESGLQIVDVGDPTSPTLLSVFPQPFVIQLPVADVSVTDGIACTIWERGLQFIDVTEPATPQQIGLYRIPIITRGSAVSDGTAFVVSEFLRDEIQVLDVHQPRAPRPLGLASLPVREILAHGRYAYIRSRDGVVRILDASDPSSLTTMGSISVDGYLRGIFDSALQTYLLAWRGDQTALRIVDVSDPALPSIVGSYVADAIVWGYGHGDRLYVTRWNAGLDIVDISDPSAPVLRGTYPIDRSVENVTVARVFVQGSRAYVTGSPRFVILDVSDPSSPTLLGSRETKLRGIHVSGELAYLWEGRGLEIVDVSDPTSPTLRGSFLMPRIWDWDAGLIASLSVMDGAVYTSADGRGGLWILRYAGPVPGATAANVRWPSYD